MPPAILTVKEAAAHLHISEWWARELLRTGQLKGRKISKHGHWRIPIGEVERITGQTEQKETT